jgi:hypothetical protein
MVESLRKPEKAEVRNEEGEEIKSLPLTFIDIQSRQLINIGAKLLIFC